MNYSDGKCVISETSSGRHLGKSPKISAFSNLYVILFRICPHAFEEYDGYDDVYGHSVDDDSCISPTDAQQWLYDRARGQQSISSFIATHRDINEEEEDEDEEVAAQQHAKLRRDSEVRVMNENASHFVCKQN